MPLLAQGGPADYVAYWDFNEGQGGTLGDQSVNAFDGQIFGAQWTMGIAGTGLQFNGASDYVVVSDGNGHPDLIGDLAVGTISVWFKFGSSPPGGEIHPILYLGDGIGGLGNSSLIIEVGHFGMETELFFTILDDNMTVTQCFDSGFSLQTDTWYHFAAVVGQGFNTGYLNGIEMTQRHYNFGGPADDDFFQEVVNKQVCWFGRGKFGPFTADQWMDGAMDEFRIYDRALSALEIQQLMRLGTQTYPGTLEDYVLKTGVNGGPCTTGGSNDTKQVLRGHTLTVLLESPGLTFSGAPIILAAEFVPTGMVSSSAHLQGLWLGFSGLFLLVDGTQPGPAGFNCVVIPGGTSFGFQIPVTLMPQSVVLQGAVLSFSAFSGLALSEAHDIQIL